MFQRFQSYTFLLLSLVPVSAVALPHAHPLNAGNYGGNRTCADAFNGAHALPAAGIIGLAALTAVIALAGALILFKKPRK